jgi:hypothetical protein
MSHSSNWSDIKRTFVWSYPRPSPKWLGRLARAHAGTIFNTSSLPNVTWPQISGRQWHTQILLNFYHGAFTFMSSYTTRVSSRRGTHPNLLSNPPRKNIARKGELFTARVCSSSTNYIFIHQSLCSFNTDPPHPPTPTHRPPPPPQTKFPLQQLCNHA